MRHKIFIGFLMALFFSSCKPDVKPVTKEEAVEFARQLEESINKKDPSILNEIFDPATIKKRIYDASNKKIPSDVLAQVPEALQKKKMGNEVIRSMGADGGTYQIVRVYEKDGKQHM